MISQITLTIPLETPLIQKALRIGGFASMKQFEIEVLTLG